MEWRRRSRVAAAERRRRAHQARARRALRPGLVTASLMLGCTACATTTRICPVGTQLVSDRQPSGRAQWCATTSTVTAAMPLPGRSYNDALGSGRPKAVPGGVQGPFTSWYPTGKVESHGSYVDLGARSVPDGVWGFWYPHGQRRTLGMYRRGQPVGCFAAWEPDGTRSTGFVEGEQLRVRDCTPPPDDELLAVEGHGRGRTTPRWGDISVQGFIGAGGIGARNSEQLDPAPSLESAFNVAARKRLGRIRVGPSLGLRVSENTSYRGFTGGAVLAFGLPSLHPRLDAEVSAELSAQYLSVTAVRPRQLGTAELDFWAPLAAAQLGVALTLSPNLEALAAVRVDGAPTRDADRTVTYCDLVCYAQHQEVWRVGGVAYGVSLGLRLVLP